MDEEKNNETELPEEGGLGQLQELLAEAERQRDEYLSGWQRAKADLINHKKEEYQRTEELVRYGNEGIIREFISVLDNFDLGLRALEKSGPVEKGVYLIRSQIEDILKKRGLEKIDIAEGEPFDPNKAEAMTAIDSEQPEGTIIEVIEPGYRLYDKLVRAARVIVSKGKKE